MEETLAEMVAASGFEVIAPFEASGLVARDEVRDMCAADKCHAYNRSWACPPACGDLAWFQERFGDYDSGYVFQTIARMADAFDYEALEAASRLHEERLCALAEKLSETAPELGEPTGPPSVATAPNSPRPLLLGAGTCRLCSCCSYPDAPCRFPEKVYPSMEAAGLLVSEVCQLAGIPYYHGPGTVAYVSCVLEPSKTPGARG
ncbi:MAG: DUF2284 domain-containing protein [Coriobacteriales bacterium]|jgi:predicted metal-binding protein|nr:DUF2284 domain-containing protein [Coriobacteriales bacterium]